MTINHYIITAIAIAVFAFGGVIGYFAKPNPNRWELAISPAIFKFDCATGRLWVFKTDRNEWLERGVGR